MKKLLCLLFSILICLFAISCVAVEVYDDDDDDSEYQEDEENENDDEDSIDGDEADDSEDTEEIEIESKTILIYMVGSNLQQAAIWDLQEMTDADFDDEKNNVIVYIGGAEEWPTDVLSSRHNTTYRVQDNDIFELERERRTNMGDAETLTEFIRYGIDNFPADQYSLILWDHGGGPFGIYGYDMNYSDGLYMEEIVAALEDAGIGDEYKFEFLGFDACLMASAETAWALKDMASCIIFSQEIEPCCGWNYSFLSEIDSCNTAKELGRAIIDDYIDGCEEFFDDYPNQTTDLTLSCVDLSKIDDFESALDDLFEEADIMHTEDIYKNVVKSRRRAKAFGKFGTNYEYDMVDIVNLCELMEDDFPDETEAVLEIMDEMVVYEKSDISDANGLSIYFPYSNKDSLRDNLYSYENFDFAPKYTRFIGDFAELLTNEDNNSWRSFDARTLKSNVSDTDGSADTFSVQLTEEQMANYSNANFFILEKTDKSTNNFFEEYTGEKYRIVYKGSNFTLDESGLLSAPLPKNLLYIIDERFSVSDTLEIPLQLIQVSDGSGKDRYHIPAMFEYLRKDFDMVPVYWQVEIKGDDIVFQGAVPISDKDSVYYGQKQLLDYTQCSHIAFSPAVYLQTLDENGTENTPDKWQYLGSSGYEVEPQYGFHAELHPLTDKENYLCYFMIEDLQGNTYVTNTVSLS